MALACVVPSDFRSPASSRVFSSAIARGVVRIRDQHMRQIYFHRRRSSPGFRGMTASKTTEFPRPDMKGAFALNAGLLFPVSNLTVLCWLCPPEALIARSTSGQTRISVLRAERSGMSVWKIFQKQTDFPADQVDGLFCQADCVLKVSTPRRLTKEWCGQDSRDIAAQECLARRGEPSPST